MKTEEARKVFDDWTIVADEVKRLSAIIQNPEAIASLTPEDVENWIKGVRIAHKMITHVANSTLKVILDEESYEKRQMRKPCPHCQCPLLDEGEGPNVCENPTCPENRYEP